MLDLFIKTIETKSKKCRLNLHLKSFIGLKTKVKKSNKIYFIED